MIALGRQDTLRCPRDDFEFRPYYSDGACPVCGWTPEGVSIERPWWQGLDPLWLAIAAMLAVSLVMGAVVLAVYLNN